MNDHFRSGLIICAILFCVKIGSICGIINGRDPKLNEVKYVVVLSSRGTCSGGIIGDKHILTAAHCIKLDKNNKVKPLKVVAATNSSTGYNTKVSLIKYVRRAFVPAAYAEKTKTNDIAVLELTGSIEIRKNSHKLQKLKLPIAIKYNPITYPNYVGRKFKAAGFGSRTVEFVSEKNGKVKAKTSDGGSLQVANATVIDTAICKKKYPKKPMENRMCSVVTEDPRRKTFQGFCYGDSGAPIVVDDNTVIGVYVAADSCDSNETPDISIKTTSFIPFIENAMNYNGTAIPGITIYRA